MFWFEAGEDVLIQFVGESIENDEQQLSFVGKVNVKGADAYPCFRCYVVGCGFFVSALLEQFNGCLNNFLFGLPAARLLWICRNAQRY